MPGVCFEGTCVALVSVIKAKGGYDLSDLLGSHQLGFYCPGLGGVSLCWSLP